MKCLLVEDDESIGLLTSERLEDAGYPTTWARSLAQIPREAIADFGFIVLDWHLPDGEGPDFISEIRKHSPVVPILLLTARVAPQDVVKGLKAGAVDYIRKPFHFSELLARIEAHTRGARPESTSGGVPVESPSITGRSQGGGTSTLMPNENHLVLLGKLSVNRDAHEVFWAGKKVDLSRLEYMLLSFFMANPDKVFTREEILDRVWGEDNYGTNRTIDTHILQLRKKLEASLFETVWGSGYRFVSKATLVCLLLLVSSFSWVQPLFASFFLAPGSEEIARVQNIYQLALEDSKDRALAEIRTLLIDQKVSTEAWRSTAALLHQLVANRVEDGRRFPDEFVNLDHARCQQQDVHWTCGESLGWEVTLRERLGLETLELRSPGGNSSRSLEATDFLVANELEERRQHMMESKALSLVGGGILDSMELPRKFKIGKRIHFRIEREGGVPTLRGFILRLIKSDKSSMAREQSHWLWAWVVDRGRACVMAGFNSFREEIAYDLALDVLDTYGKEFICGKDRPFLRL